MFKGKPRKRHLQHIADKIKCKQATWKGSILSIMGRVLLVNLIIHSMLLYNFMIYFWLISLLKDIDKWTHNFIWFGDIMNKKLVTTA